jgi:hypothetical protein
MPASFAVDFRLALARRDPGSAAARRLGLTAAGSSYEVYFTFRPDLPEAAKCTGNTFNDVSMTASLYDVFVVHSDTDQVWTYSCDAVTVYKTMSGMYCPHNNIKTYGPNSSAAVRAERCVTKCDKKGPKPGVDTATAYCDGYDETFTPTSNALCLPRASCEALCKSTEGCIGFDMHLLTNRCWLNTAYCLPGANPSLEASGGAYEVSSDFDFVYRAFGKTEYTTLLPSLTCAEYDAGSEISVEELTNSCENKCAGPKGTIISVLADSPRTVTHTEVKAAYLGVDKIVQISSGEVAVGLVDPLLKELPFAPPVALPAAMSDMKSLEVVATPDGFTIFGVGYGDGVGLLSVTGTFSEYTLAITFGTVQQLSLGVTVVDLLDAVAVTDGPIVLAITTTDGAAGVVIASGVPTVVPLGPAGSAQVAATANLVAYAVSGAELTVYSHKISDTSVTESVSIADLAGCNLYQGLAAVSDDVVLVTCEDQSAVLCDLDSGTCGTVTTDWSGGTETATAEAGLGYDVVCPKTTTCFARTVTDHMSMLTVSAADLSITAAVAMADFTNPAANSTMIALMPGNLYIARTEMYETALTRTEADYAAYENASAPYDFTVTSGSAMGVLFSELGSTWDEPATGECDYYGTATLTGSEICGGRAACESACAEAGSSCAAFVYTAGSKMCKLYSACTQVENDDPSATLVSVIKAETHMCTVTVTGGSVDTEIASRCTHSGAACDISTVYYEMAETRGQMEFRTKDNISRIVFDDSRGCAGWMLEQNREAYTKVPVVTFLDAKVDVVNDYRAVFLATYSNYTADDLPNCPELDTATATAWSCTHPVVGALCKATCMTLTTASVADEMVTFHQLGAYTGDDAAATDYTSGAADCSTSKKKDCDSVLSFLCPDKCKDEFTKVYDEIKKDFLLGDSSATWDPLFATFANGSQFASTFGGEEVPVEPYGYTQCKTIAPSGQRSLLQTDKVYRAVVPGEPALSMKPVCASETLCPSLTTCVEAEHMFTLEMEKLRSPPFSTKIENLNSAAIMHSTAWLDGETPRDFSDADFDYKFPKVLISANRAEAVIRVALWEFGKEIFRAAPGATRVRLHQFPASAVSAVASLSSVEDEWAVSNFGRTYAVPAGYGGWLTDVMRLELFVDGGSPMPWWNWNEYMIFEVFIPGASGTIYVFVDGVKSNYASITASTVGDTTQGWYQVSIPAGYASADFLFAQDLNECADPASTGCEAPEDGGKCVNDEPSAGGYHCECISGYKGENGELPGTALAVGVQCVLAQYVAPDQHFLVYHNDAAEYGLHVGEIHLFESSDKDGGCLGECPNKKMGANCHYGFVVGDRADTTGLSIRNLEVSGEYPGHGKAGLKDNSDGEWWANTLALDRVSGKGAWISFTVPAAKKVDCVRLELTCSKGMPSQFQLHRGKKGAVDNPSAYAYAGEGFTPGGEPGFTETVTGVAKDGKVDLAVPCGIEDAQYFGEEFLDYVGVDTPCECKQLCVDHIDEGCATWKWYLETEHCFLQRDTFVGVDGDSEVLPSGALATARASFRSKYANGTGWWKRSFAEGWPGWVTGTTGPLAIGVETTPATPVVGEAFSVRLYGAGFPYDEEIGDDLGARQRIKIVPKDGSCVLDMPPDSVEGIDCTNWFTCSPKPDTYSRTSAKWSGLTITAQKADVTYKVCWCAGKCWMLTNWVEVPGEISAIASGYSWALEEAGVVTKLAAREGIQLRVSRPAFSSLAPTTGWTLKLVRDVFDCTTLADAEICSGDVCPQSSDFGPDEVLFVITSTADVVAGDYSICFSEDGTTFVPIPSATTRYFTVTSQPSDLDHPTGPFHHQKISARAGKSASVVLKGFGLALPNQQSVALVNADSCYIPPDGNDFKGSGIVAILTGATSTSEEYSFVGDVPSTLKGKYTLCMCDDESWVTNRYESRPASWTGSSYYYAAASLVADYDLTELAAVDKGYSVSFATWDGSDGTVPAGAESDLCVTKCSAGCVGPTCFCDGFLSDDEATYGTTSPGPLCLDAAACRTLCDSTTGCSGYAMAKGKNRCFISTGGADSYNADYDLFIKKATTPCRTVADFLVMNGTKSWMKEMEVKKNVGEIFVTQKADLGVDFVVTPDATVSIEITGEDLSSAGDRIMVIDCYGSCGITKASAYALIGEPVPANAFIDRPSLPTAPADLVVPMSTYKTYNKLAGKYCAGNLAATPDTNMAGHRCFKKCFEDAPCEGDSCFCDGYIPGYDTEDSDSICLERQQCEWLCELTPGCHSVDMHKTLNRCFLNTDSCDVDTAIPTADYDLLVKAPTDDNTRRLLARGRSLTTAQVRELLAAKDPGISWEKVLRYRDVKITSAGKYKLCFCDSDLLDGALCRTPADYSIEIGTVHATGLQCLLSNPKMTRGTCVSQYFGGLRCYDEAVPDITVPTQYLGIPDPSGQEWDSLTTMMMGFCQYAPAEEAAVFPFCAQYRAENPAPAFPTATP